MLSISPVLSGQFCSVFGGVPVHFKWPLLISLFGSFYVLHVNPAGAQQMVSVLLSVTYLTMLPCPDYFNSMQSQLSILAVAF